MALEALEECHEQLESSAWDGPGRACEEQVADPAELVSAPGVERVPPPLPDTSLQWRNVMYAVQWWVFAAFGAFMTVRFVRALGRQGSLGRLSDQEEE